MKRKFSKQPKSAVTSARAIKAGSAIDKYWEIYDNLSPEEAQEWDRVVARRYPSFWDREMTEEVAEWALSVKGVDPDEDDDDENIVTIVMTALSDAGFDVSSFEDAGLLTKNDGFVIRKGGQDYQFSLLGSWRG